MSNCMHIAIAMGTDNASDAGLPPHLPFALSGEGSR